MAVSSSVSDVTGLQECERFNIPGPDENPGNGGGMFIIRRISIRWSIRIADGKVIDRMRFDFFVMLLAIANKASGIKFALDKVLLEKWDIV